MSGRSPCPWPYTLAKGTVIEQAVRLSVHGTARCQARRDSAVVVRIGEETGAVPAARRRPRSR